MAAQLIDKGLAERRSTPRAGTYLVGTWKARQLDSDAGRPKATTTPPANAWWLD